MSATPAASAPPAPASSPTPAPAPASAEAQQPTPSTTVVAAPAEEQPPKRRTTEKILGRKPTADIEAQTHDDDADETRKKKKKVAAGMLATLTMIAMITLGSILLSAILFVLSSYTFPMLACKMHGYNSQCMFNPYDAAGESVGEWFSDNLPGRMGGFHRQDW